MNLEEYCGVNFFNSLCDNTEAGWEHLKHFPFLNKSQRSQDEGY